MKNISSSSFLDLLQLILAEQLWEPQGFLKGFLFKKYDYAFILKTVLCSEKLSMLKP